MSVQIHQRPGVYSSYDVTALRPKSGGRKTVGLAALSQKGKPGEVQTFTSHESAALAFGGKEEAIVQLIRIILLNGAAAVAAVPVRDQDGYAAAFQALQAQDGISLVLCDSTELTVQQALRDSVIAASAARRERIALAAGGAQEAVSALVTRAKALNSERMVLVAPGTVDTGGTPQSGVTACAAVAGVLAAQQDPAIPLGGAQLIGLSGLSAQYGDNDIDLLIQGGVTPLESVAGTVSVIRGVTTRTKTGEAEDTTWRELSTILIVDDIIPSIRNSLSARFRRVKNTAQSRGAIRSQVVLELEQKRNQEIITQYDAVAVRADTENPTVCRVDFSFTVAHGLNQIWLNAHITI